MRHNVFETILGAVVLALAAVFISFAYSSADLNRVKGYKVTANFTSVDGVKQGTDVDVNGVKIGSVDSLRLLTDPGPDQYLVAVTMSIDPSVQLPDDTVAMVATESLLGGKNMTLEPGVDDVMIKTDGTGKLTHTQAPMNLDNLIGQLIYSSKRGDSGSASAPAAAPAAAPASPAPAAAKPAHP